MKKHLKFGLITLLGALLGTQIVSVQATEIYNKSKTTNSNGPIKLYNSSRPDLPSQGDGGLKVIKKVPTTSDSYYAASDKTITPRVKTDTMLTQYLDAYTVKSREADVDLAIKSEFQAQIDTRKKLNEENKKFANAISKLEAEHDKKVQEYLDRKAKEDAKKEMRKSGKVVSSLVGSSKKNTLYNTSSSQENDIYDRSKTGKKLYNTRD